MIGKTITQRHWRARMRVFVDTNVILDVVLKREPFAKDSAAFLSLCGKRKAALAPCRVAPH